MAYNCTVWLYFLKCDSQTHTFFSFECFTCRALDWPTCCLHTKQFTVFGSAVFSAESVVESAETGSSMTIPPVCFNTCKQGAKLEWETSRPNIQKVAWLIAFGDRTKVRKRSFNSACSMPFASGFHSSPESRVLICRAFTTYSHGHGRSYRHPAQSGRE
jgi:hypothetical protein